MSTEKAIFTARAVVYYFDNAKRSWAPTAVGQDFCRVDMYENTANNTFRVIGRGLKDTSKIVINSNITKDTTYTRASETFHQWSDNRYIYGLNFALKEEAESFGTGVEGVIGNLKGAPPPPGPPNPPIAPPHNTPTTPTNSNGPPTPPSNRESMGPPAPPQPPPTPPVTTNTTGRSALLSSITSFSKNNLKKADTVDKSGPLVKQDSASSSNAGSNAGGNLMAQIMQKRSQMGGNLPLKVAESTGSLGKKTTAPPISAAINSPIKLTMDPKASFKKTATPPVVNPPLGGLTPKTDGNIGSSASDLSALKEEILAEMRRELQQMKEDILAAIQNR